MGKGPPSGPRPRPEPGSRAELVALGIQGFAVAAFAGLAAIEALTGNEINRLAYVGLLAFGLGVRPDSLGDLLRKVVS